MSPPPLRNLRAEINTEFKYLCDECTKVVDKIRNCPNQETLVGLTMQAVSLKEQWIQFLITINDFPISVLYLDAELSAWMFINWLNNRLDTL